MVALMLCADGWGVFWRTGGVELFTALAPQQIDNELYTLPPHTHTNTHTYNTPESLSPSSSGTVIEFQWSDQLLPPH